MKKQFLLFGFIVLLLSACTEKNYSKKASYAPLIEFSKNSGTFYYTKNYKRIYLDSNEYVKRRGKPDSLGKASAIRNYEITYRERKDIRNNLLEISTENEMLTDSKFDYIHVNGYYQKLYLKNLNFRFQGMPAYLYSSLKFGSENTVNHIGKAYIGGLHKVYQHKVDSSNFQYVITFTHHLEFKKRSASYKLSKIHTPIMFCVDIEPGEKTIRVKSIIMAGNNKIGGKKPLVYDIKTVMGNENALTFKKP